MLEDSTDGRLTLGDAHGTLWKGSAFFGGAAGRNDPAAPLLPGRFSWHLSPMIFLGSVDAELENPVALSEPVAVTGNWRRWQVSHGSIVLPAERLAALGAPLNTLQPSGQMRLSWETLQLVLHNGVVNMTGTMKVELMDIGSRLSPVKPLGSYNLVLDWRGERANVSLATDRGPLLLNGAGSIKGARLQFSGTAQAEDGEEQRLANFLNLLGQHRKVGGKDVISLDFK